MEDHFVAGLNRFFDQFSSTRELVNGLIRARSHPQEILILLCARIDALAANSSSDEESSARSFTGFVTTYSGNSKLFDSVSLGDLYYEFDYHLWLLPGMIEKAGRLHIFSRLDEPVFRLLVGSEIPLTLTDAQKLMRKLQRILRAHFRVAPHQSLKKKPLASVKRIKEAIWDGFRGKRDRISRDALLTAIDPMISSKTLARILYERFRCEAIHGGQVLIEESKFFTEDMPYWKPMYSEFYGPFQLLEFPARFLASVFSDCLENYRKRLEARRKVPPGVHFQMFPDDPLGHLELLEENLLATGRTVVPRL
jgi:hypothetical protein